ncbi:hypothetical protein V4E86_14045 [Burkholderia pseudomallei]
MLTRLRAALDSRPINLLERSLIGTARRSLFAIFDRDVIERDKVQRFFDA